MRFDGSRGSTPHVHRDADSLASAIISAVGQTEAAGFAVVGVRTENLVTLKTIAASGELSALAS